MGFCLSYCFLGTFVGDKAVMKENIVMIGGSPSPLPGKTLLVVVLVVVVVVLVKLYLLLVHKYNANVRNASKPLQYKDKLIIVS